MKRFRIRARVCTKESYPNILEVVYFMYANDECEVTDAVYDMFKNPVSMTSYIKEIK